MEPTASEAVRGAVEQALRHLPRRVRDHRAVGARFQIAGRNLTRENAAVIFQRHFLILDEPTAGIDIGAKAEIISLIRDLARQGKAILLISSELSELLAASDRVLVMSEGRIVRDILRRDLDAGADTPANLDHAERQLQIALQKARAHV